MQSSQPTPQNLRIALFSGNYNMVKDGANQALNRLVEYLLRQGAAVRVYSPTVPNPDFAPQGDLVSAPSFSIPTRSEYRFATGMNAEVRADLEAFAPNIIHISSPDNLARAAVKWGKARGLPVAASVHTAFETYLSYYHLGFLEPVMVAWLRRLYRRCDALLVPSDGFADVLRQQRMNDDIALWTRGVDRDIFSPAARNLAWRESHGIAADDVAIGFLGRLVLEKGLGTFADAIAILQARGLAHKVLVVGEGPAREYFQRKMPDAVFVGFQGGKDLGRAVASMDILLNPSHTEAFGNVTLEAMACGVPVVGAIAAGTSNIVVDGETGLLVPPVEPTGFADALARYIEDPAMRLAHGAAGAARADAYSWDPINRVVLDKYLELVAR